MIFATTVAVTLLVPFLVAAPLPFDAVGDLLAVVYLLLLGTFFLALAGLDPGTAFGGMGASREMTVAAIAEPTIALAIFGLALGAGSTNLGRIVAQTLSASGTAISPGHLLGVRGALHRHAGRDGAAAGGQSGDAPRADDDPRGDDPGILGPLPGAHRVGGSAQAADLLLAAGEPVSCRGEWRPRSRRALVMAVIALIAKLALLVLAVVAIETRVAKLRLFRVPELLGVSFVLALLAVTSSFSAEVIDE